MLRVRLKSWTVGIRGPLTHLLLCLFVLLAHMNVSSSFRLVRVRVRSVRDSRCPSSARVHSSWRGSKNQLVVWNLLDACGTPCFWTESPWIWSGTNWIYLGNWNSNPFLSSNKLPYYSVNSHGQKKQWLSQLYTSCCPCWVSLHSWWHNFSHFWTQNVLFNIAMYSSVYRTGCEGQWKCRL